MRTIEILDTTLRDGEQSPGCSMHISEKLEIAECLESLGIDVIEAGFPVISDGDFSAVCEIAKLVKNSKITALSRCTEKDIDAARDALKPTDNKRLHLFIATSPIHLKYKLKLTEDEVVEKMLKSIAYGKRFFDEIQFSFEDACRTPLPFLTRATQEAVNAGAKIINIPDTVGYITPSEITEVFKHLKNNVDGIDNVTLSTHNHNDLGLAVANSIAAVLAGAGQVEGTINGIGERAGNVALEEVIMGFDTRKEYYGVTTNVNTKKLYRACKTVSAVVGVKIPPNKAVVGANAFLHEAGIHQHGVIESPLTYEIMTPESIGISTSKIALGKHSGRHAFATELKNMGYDLSEDVIDLCFTKFKALADRKKSITKKDIEAILPRVTRNLADRKYLLVSYESNSFLGGASMTVSLSSDGRIFTETESGDGPVDAAFKAINNITGRDMKLRDFAIHSVTEGKDALGETTIKLEYGGQQYTGRGVSTDVLESAILAYLSAVNMHLGEKV